MKVLNESYSELRLKRPLDWGLSLFMLIWGSGFIVMPLFMLHLLLQGIGISQVNCDRPEPSIVACELQQTGYFGLIQQQPERYTGVTGAAMQTEIGRSSENKRLTYTYWVTVETDKGRQTLMEAPMMVNNVSGDKIEMSAIAAQIHQFIQSGQLSLTITRDNRQDVSSYAFSFISLLFPLVGFTAIYFSLQSEELTFDREQGLLLRQRKTLLGSKHQQVSLHDIKTTEIKTQQGKHTYYQLKLLPDSLKTRPLMLSRRRSEVADIESKVKQFLHSHPS